MAEVAKFALIRILSESRTLLTPQEDKVVIMPTRFKSLTKEKRQRCSSTLRNYKRQAGAEMQFNITELQTSKEVSTLDWKELHVGKELHVAHICMLT